MVNTPGVGFPSGVIGILSIVLNIHNEDILHQAGGVNWIESLSAPAKVIPGISEVSVYEITNEKRNLPDFMNLKF